MNDRGLHTWVGLDIGGANLKSVHEWGTTRVEPFALWKQPERLADELRILLGGMPRADRFAVTMTGELCDCFANRNVGVLAILEAVVAVVPESAVRVWGIDGSFHRVSRIREVPSLAASANWLATATVAARFLPKRAGMLIDIGSTTTDLIPFRNGKVAVVGRTDMERLQSGELVYAGATRTPVCAIANELPWKCGTIGLAAELFATTRDIALILGELPPDPNDLDTADGQPSTTEGARTRLARMIGADQASLSDPDISELAQAVYATLVDRLVASGRKVCRGANIERLDGVIVAGSGEFLARRVAECLLDSQGTLLSLTERWGKNASTAACAYALVVLAKDAEL